MDRAIDYGLGLSALSWAAHALAGGRAATLVGATIICLNASVGVLFLLRRPAVRRASLRDAVLCLASVPTSALALKLAPPIEQWPLAAEVIFAVAGAGAVASLWTLGGSFGVLPALRGIVQRGPFRLVRHPAYACELLMVLSCTLAASSLASLWPALLAIALMVVRIRIEERLLGESQQYAAYGARVRWRLLPGVW
jgi:protein-S-isoprenylcysteine O-methyltransferase Ste14